MELKGECGFTDMRYETKVIFVNSGDEAYNPETSEWEINEDSQQIRWCSMYDLGTNRANDLFGNLDVKGYVIQHLGSAISADYVLISERKYHIVTFRTFKHKTSYILKEVQ